MWNQYFKDREIWEEIDKDVKRTRSDMNFFNQPVDQEKAHLLDTKNGPKFSFYGQDKPCETHSDVLARILFIYAKINKSIIYV